ncbi:GNAT family N-acetyltransferase [Paenibacillus soyae]|nr:GNAT family N-acetyltransferase [Paenibacillus soyae]
MEDSILKIDGKDIIVREFIESDLEAFHSLTWQPEIHDYLPGWNVSKEQRRDWFLNYELPDNQQFRNAVMRGGEIGDLRLRMAIVSKQTGELIGWCCTGIKDELPPPNREIMYAVSRDHRGKGYAAQAAHALIRYLFENTNVETLVAIALVHNDPSNRVLRKCGFRFESTIELEDGSYHYYRLYKDSVH